MMTKLIASWNPVSFHEIHGYYTQFQIEPCSPAHEPCVEYDLFIEDGIKQGEAFGAAAITNNDTINSFNMPMRDYLFVDGNGNKEWYPFDDMSTSYTPQYALVHGTHAYTVELPYGSADAVTAIKYGFIGNADYVAANKEAFFMSQLKGYERGMNNVDADEIRQYYVSQSDEAGAEADVFRPKYEENNNFFPEYYVIPLDAESQQDTQSASEIVAYLLDNDVRLKVLDSDFTVNGTTYKAGTVIVDMHQAKRNMANAALYKNVLITDWTDLYSEPVTNFSDLRGFDMDIITTVGAFADAQMSSITEPVQVTTTVFGEGVVTVISNNSLHAVNAVNDLIDAGAQVGYITEGEYKGDFVVSSADFAAVKDNYILIAYQSNVLPTASVITKTPKIYVPGRSATFMTNNDGNEIGVANYRTILDYSYGWDIFAFSKQMNFDLADSAEEADIIIGSGELTDSELALIANGMPYIGYTGTGLDNAQSAGVAIDFEPMDWYDALTTVTYEDASMITDKYVQEGDNLVYAYGGNYFHSYPDDAVVLMRTTNDTPVEGFMPSEWLEAYKGQVIAIDYQATTEAGTYDMTLFANTVTNKAHQQDEYRLVSNAIYKRYLGDAFTMEVPEEPEQPTDPTDPTKPTDPTDPTKPTDPANPDETKQPTNTNTNGGSGSKNTNSSKAAKTGDFDSVTLYAGLLVTALLGMTVIVIRRKREWN